MGNNVKESYGVATPCNAPFNNMYFTVKGKVSPCWKLPGYCDEWSPDRSIMDIWKGEKFQNYRDALQQNIFLFRCKECKHEMDTGSWPLAKAYEEYPVQEHYPSMMELELSNQCNLECIMCSGNLSSGIRKNREKLPPLPQIYNDQFREELHEFIPHLTELRFNGGEPFAQKIVLDICDDVSRINPDLKINIATNGTVYNKRVRHILDNNNIHLNISIDSLKKDRYEEIRINGDFDLLMKNFEIFRDNCHTNNRKLSIMVNPMRNNWDEMIDFLIFCFDNNCKLWYNTILYPKHLALWNLPIEELKHVYNTLSKKLHEVDNRWKDIGFTIYNLNTARHLIRNQIANWILDAKERDEESSS